MTTLAVPDNAKFYDDVIAAGSDKSYPTISLVRLELMHFGRKPGRLLEYAFGTGCNLIHFLDCGYEVDGLDTSPHAKALVERKLAKRSDIAARARLGVLDVASERLPFEDGTFDYIVAASVLSLLSSREKVAHLLGEFHRVIKPGGKLMTDINGPRSEFVIYGKPLGNNVHEYRGSKGTSPPLICYCPDTPEVFAELVGEHFAIDDIGYSEHRLFDNVEHEYFICAHRD